MDKSNKFIWVNSFAADEEVPKCPKDISEPAWAQLLYSPYCQVRRRVVPPSIQSKDEILKRHLLCVALSFFAGYRCLLGFVSSVVQKVPSRGVGSHEVQRAPSLTHVRFYRVTSQNKAMEDAVEIGLRSAFNEVNFTSFNKVLPWLKLRGEHP